MKSLYILTGVNTSLKSTIIVIQFINLIVSVNTQYRSLAHDIKNPTRKIRELYNQITYTICPKTANYNNYRTEININVIANTTDLLNQSFITVSLKPYNGLQWNFLSPPCFMWFPSLPTLYNY